MFDSEERKLIRLSLDLETLPEIIEDKVDCLFILLRRRNGKEKALEFLTELIQNRHNFQLLPPIFKNLNEILKKAEREGLEFSSKKDFH